MKYPIPLRPNVVWYLGTQTYDACLPLGATSCAGEITHIELESLGGLLPPAGTGRSVR